MECNCSFFHSSLLRYSAAGDCSDLLLVKLSFRPHFEFTSHFLTIFFISFLNESHNYSPIMRILLLFSSFVKRWQYYNVSIVIVIPCQIWVVVFKSCNHRISVSQTFWRHVMQDMGYPQFTDSNYSRNKHYILKVFSLETLIHALKIIHGLWLRIRS